MENIQPYIKIDARRHKTDAKVNQII